MVGETACGAQFQSRRGRGCRRSRLRVHTGGIMSFWAAPAVTLRRVCPAVWPMFIDPDGELPANLNSRCRTRDPTRMTRTGCTAPYKCTSLPTAVGQRILSDWTGQQRHFSSRMPRDYNGSCRRSPWLNVTALMSTRRSRPRMTPIRRLPQIHPPEITERDVNLAGGRDWRKSTRLTTRACANRRPAAWIGW